MVLLLMMMVVVVVLMMMTMMMMMHSNWVSKDVGGEEHLEHLKLAALWIF